MKSEVIKNWNIALFNKSALKQNKFEEIVSLLENTESLSCLDIGSDNGVISYLLRQRGGYWKSADLDENTVSSIRELVKSDVFRIDSLCTPFSDNEFDRVVIVDFLEHIQTDKEFLDELFRIMKPGSELIINVPHIKNSLLRQFRLCIGQTDERHGHLRPGYTIDGIRTLLGSKFTILHYKTYSKFFSELIDILVTFAYGVMKGSEQEEPKKGVFVTGSDLNKYKKLFRVYSLIYPLVWIFSNLDLLLFFQSGYMLIVKARVNKQITNIF